MSLCDNEERSVGSTMAAVHRELLRFCGSVDEVRTQIQLPSMMEPPKSDSGGADLRSFSSSAS